jgi:hypothetical protein
MAYAFVQSGNNHQTSAATITASSITVTAGNALVIWICTSTIGAQTVSGNSNTYTYVGTSAISNSLYMSAYFAKNINSGATAVASSDTGCFGIYAAEYSGLSTTATSLGFISNDQASGGLGTDVLTATALNVGTVPAGVFAFTVDAGGVQVASSNTGTMPAGVALAWNLRNPGWVDGSAVTVATAEDIRVTSSGNVTATFGTTGNKQFAAFITAAFALPETGASSNTATIAWTV